MTAGEKVQLAAFLAAVFLGGLLLGLSQAPVPPLPVCEPWSVHFRKLPDAGVACTSCMPAATCTVSVDLF